MSVRTRRIYDGPDPDDGVRVLVDRLWPRGVCKEEAHVDEWPKGLTPSTAPRTQELKTPEAAELLDGLRKAVRKGPVTLLTASKEPAHSQARVLLDLLKH
ncbi:DUF488 domain-containing protein [Streptomyces monashensis]|uniref:MarR family transcriptional regulator n=1 Tax=Streptomyces monashensis TaxID=1678012 RepID=A0A1S2PK46_9ACTN|nr:DUF488 family protein [Streptomyces monashensis]OIJ93940.1 hypothetical protein BIV23_36270 [Streptomyces monashensis]